jgi:hypothetical protein
MDLIEDSKTKMKYFFPLNVHQSRRTGFLYSKGISSRTRETIATIATIATTKSSSDENISRKNKVDVFNGQNINSTKDHDTKTQQKNNISDVEDSVVEVTEQDKIKMTKPDGIDDDIDTEETLEAPITLTSNGAQQLERNAESSELNYSAPPSLISATSSSSDGTKQNLLSGSLDPLGKFEKEEEEVLASNAQKQLERHPETSTRLNASSSLIIKPDKTFPKKSNQNNTLVPEISVTSSSIGTMSNLLPGSLDSLSKFGKEKEIIGITSDKIDHKKAQTLCKRERPPVNEIKFIVQNKTKLSDTMKKRTSEHDLVNQTTVAIEKDESSIPASRHDDGLFVVRMDNSSVVSRMTSDCNDSSPSTIKDDLLRHGAVDGYLNSEQFKEIQNNIKLNREEMDNLNVKERKLMQKFKSISSTGDAELIAALQAENKANKETIAALKAEISEEKAKITMLQEKLKQRDQMLSMSNEELVQLTKHHEREKDWFHTIHLQMQQETNNLTMKIMEMQSKTTKYM